MGSCSSMCQEGTRRAHSESQGAIRSRERQSCGRFDRVGSSDPRLAHGPPSVQQQHAFLDAAKRYDFSRVRAMLLQNPDYVNCQPSGRWTALHQAAHIGDLDAVRFLLAHEASPKVQTMDGRTPLELAKPNVLEILLAALPPDMAEIPKQEAPRHCASEDTIQKLRLSKFTASPAMHVDAADVESVVCQICLDDFAEHDELRTLSCSHFFHARCVDVWLREKSCSCPVCRHQVR